MKTVAIPLMVFLLLFSCKKDDREEAGNTATFSEIMLMASSGQKAYFQLQPVQLPGYIYAMDDSMARKIIAMADLLNLTLQVSSNPSFIDASGLKNEKIYMPYDSPEGKKVKYTVECFDFPIPGCVYSWRENNGKLLVQAYNYSYTDHWAQYITYNGIDVRGYTYHDEMIQWWMTKKDLSLSQYMYYNKFPVCNEETDISLVTQWWVEGEDATLCFDNECQSLATHYYTITVYDCSQIFGHHQQFSQTMICHPDEKIEILLSVFSMQNKSLFLWIHYWVNKDHQWCITVYNDQYQIVKHECSDT
ncbi:MAG: hypothetical protein ACPLXM_07660 [Bacteroidales bacterium]